VIEVIGAGELPREKPDVPAEPYLVLEYLNGPALRAVLSTEGGKLPLLRALHIVLQIADAIGEAHELGIVHRDLKPENVMLVQRGDDLDFVKLLDFGLSRQSGSDAGFETRAGSVLGTARYLSPEGARGDPVGPAADVYSIATILFECLAGRTPFDAESAVALLVRRTQDTAMDVRSVPSGAHVPEPLALLLATSLARDMSRRPVNARDFGRRLFTAATESGLSPSALLPRSTLLGTRTMRPPPLATVEPASPAREPSVPAEFAAPVTAKPRRKRDQPLGRVALVAACFALGALGALGIATELGSCAKGGP
jgi:serine/threonine-protein kinase